MKKMYGNEILEGIHNYFYDYNKPSDLFAEKYAINGLSISSYCSLIEKLISKKILISSDVDDKEFLDKRTSQARAIRNISLMYHIPTSECNYLCNYCFIENKPQRHSCMTKEISRIGIDYFAMQSKNAKEIKVIFYGGEPLLNKEILFDAIQYIRKKEENGFFKKQVDIILLTNGSLVDDVVVAVAKKYNLRTSVSIDGPEWIHNKERIFAHSGVGTFQRSFNGYRLLKQAGLDPGISCTLSTFNVNHFDETLSFIIEELKPSGLGFNILLPQWKQPYRGEVEKATAKIIEAFKTFRKLGIYEDRIMRRARPFCSDSFHHKDCYGVGGQIVLTPEGTIGPCQAFLGLDAYFPVSVQEPPDDINSHPMFAKWIERFTLCNTECLSCRALAICGGGCPYAAEVVTGSMSDIDRGVCQQCLPIFDWLIWDLLEHLDLSLKEECL